MSRKSFLHAAVLFIVFVLFSFAVLLFPQVLEEDLLIIKSTQEILSGFSSSIPIAAGGILFYTMLFLPLISGCLVFFVKKMYRNLVLYAASPFIAYFISSIVKYIVNRPRPPLELQIEEHMTSSSYVSRHTFLTACVWVLFAFIICRYCKNQPLKYIISVFAAVWILFEGFSRIWLGVHHPSDLIGAFILAEVFLIVYIPFFKAESR